MPSSRQTEELGDEHGTYSIFARFRRQRLALMRRVPLEDALHFVVKLRAERFHDPGGVFVVCDRTGEVVDEGNAHQLLLNGADAGAPTERETRAAVSAPAKPVRRFVARSAGELQARANECLRTTGRTVAQLNASVMQLQQLLDDIQGSASGFRRRD